MDRGHLLTAALSVSLAVGAVALFGNGQLGPLDPPAGPAIDTSPSLADLSDEITGLSASLSAAASPFPPNLQVVTELGVANDVRVILEDVAGPVRLYGVVLQGGAVGLEEQSTGRVLTSLSGGALRQSDGAPLGTTQVLLGGLHAQTPLKLISFGIETGGSVHLYYWEESAGQ